MAKTPKFTLPVTHAPATSKDEHPLENIKDQPGHETVVDSKVTNKKEAQADAPMKTDSISGESFEDKVAAAVAKSMAAILPELAKTLGTAMAQGQMAVEAVKQQTAHDKLLAEAKKKLAKEEKCSVCRQVVGDGVTHGCGGPYKRNKKGDYVLEPVLNPDGSNIMDHEDKPMMRRIEDPDQFHVKMVVYPNDPLAAEWFPYLKINGVEYFSQGPNHEIYVPRKNDFASALAIYEQNEREQRVGRKHVRKFGGSVSGQGGTNMAPTGVGFS